MISFLRLSWFELIKLWMMKHSFKWLSSKGTEVAASARQHVEPDNELEVGKLVRKFEKSPHEDVVRGMLSKILYGYSLRPFTGPIEKKQGKVLDEDVQIGR